MSTKQHILDYHLNIGLPDGEESPLINNAALAHGLHGIHYLAWQVRMMELEYPAKHPEAIGALFLMESIPRCLPAMFHWFSVSVANHLRLIALVQLLQERNWRSSDLADPEKRMEVHPWCADYARKAAPALVIWRNKVAAHFAATYPNQADPVELLEQSIWTPVSYQYPFFQVGNWRPPDMSEDSALPIWQLTPMFTELAPRFWPQFEIPPLPTRAYR